MIQVLDCGYLTKIEHWGSDERIVEAARMSNANGCLGSWQICDCPLTGWRRPLNDNLST